MTVHRDRVVLVGFGAIGRAVARLLADRGGLDRLAGIAVRDPSRLRDDLPPGVPLLAGPEALAQIDAGLVIEVAGREAVAPWGHAALTAGRRFAVSSTSAFAETSLLDTFTALARQHGGQLIIPPGALGGIDALSAAARMGLEAVEHCIIKPPRAWAGTEAETLCDLAALHAPHAFFTGSAREAAARFPQNANAALITALAGLGPDRTRLTLIADPASPGNRHEITASGAFGQMRMQFDNAALPENPKSSVMTALSLLRLIENADAALVV